MANLTQLLHLAAQGEQQAIAELMPLIYERLRAIAHRQLAKEQQRTLLTNDLVHEAYFQLFEGVELAWRDQGHFFAYAATAMRNIMIDRARRRLAQKRGEGAEHVDIALAEVGVDDQYLDLLALDQALKKMAQRHPRLVSIIELRFFAGATIEEVARYLDLDPSTVERDWTKARALIHHYLGK